MSLALALESTEPEEIMDIFSQIEGIALNQKIVVNSVIEISNLVVGVMNDLDIYYHSM